MQKSLWKKQREVQKLLENVYIITIEDILWKIYKIKRKSSIIFAHELVLHFVNANNLNPYASYTYSQEDQQQLIDRRWGVMTIYIYHDYLLNCKYHIKVIYTHTSEMNAVL